MFIIAQIPFVDFRLLSNNIENYKDCIFPNKFHKVPDKPIYYRCLGAEKNRYQPNQLPLSERQFFNADKILFIDSNAFNGEACYFPEKLFSRLYEDAQIFHFDIGIRETFKNSFDRRDLNRFIKDFISSPFFSLASKYDKTDNLYNFIELTEQIKQVYLYATKRKRADEHKNYHSEIILGYPALFITYDKDEVHTFGNAKEIKINTNIKVRYDLISINHTFVSVWFIGKTDISKYNNDLRNLRIYLSKLHANKEATRLILEYLKYNTANDLDMHAIITFFQYMLSLMEQESYYGYHNTDFWKIVFDVDYNYNQIDWHEYKRYMNAKIKEVIDMSPKSTTVTVTHSTVKGPIITDSINVQINNYEQNEMEESIKNFDHVLEELLSSAQLTNEQLSSLNKQADLFKNHTKSSSSNKEFASSLLDSLESTFSCMIHNSTGIKKLIAAGKAIISLLK